MLGVGNDDIVGPSQQATRDDLTSSLCPKIFSSPLPFVHWKIPALYGKLQITAADPFFFCLFFEHCQWCVRMLLVKFVPDCQ